MKVIPFRQSPIGNYLANRDGITKNLQDIDPDLFEKIADWPSSAATVIWCKKYPQDIPDDSKWDWLREAIKY